MKAHTWVYTKLCELNKPYYNVELVLKNKIELLLREGLRNKIKKKYGIFHTFLPPPHSGGVKYGIYL